MHMVACHCTCIYLFKCFYVRVIMLMGSYKNSAWSHENFYPVFFGGDTVPSCSAGYNQEINTHTVW